MGKKKLDRAKDGAEGGTRIAEAPSRSDVLLVAGDHQHLPLGKIPDALFDALAEVLRAEVDRRLQRMTKEDKAG